VAGAKDMLLAGPRGSCDPGVLVLFRGCELDVLLGGVVLGVLDLGTACVAWGERLIACAAMERPVRDMLLAGPRDSSTGGALVVDVGRELGARLRSPLSSSTLRFVFRIVAWLGDSGELGGVVLWHGVRPAGVELGAGLSDPVVGSGRCWEMA